GRPPRRARARARRAAGGHRWTVEECKAIKAEYQQKLKDLCESRSEAV
ncbi:Protein ninG, partial [Salmonella enterica subsp. enterica serovar Cerro str. FSL R8-0235]